VCGVSSIDEGVCVRKECLIFIHENGESLTDPVVPDSLVGSDLEENGHESKLDHHVEAHATKE